MDYDKLVVAVNKFHKMADAPGIVPVGSTTEDTIGAYQDVLINAGLYGRKGHEQNAETDMNSPIFTEILNPILDKYKSQGMLTFTIEIYPTLDVKVRATGNAVANKVAADFARIWGPKATAALKAAKINPPQSKVEFMWLTYG